MARYIDEKDAYALVEPSGVARVHCSQIDALPRADVVPKSEYDAAIIDRNAARLGMIAEHERLKMARAEVAREIFEELAIKSTYVFPTMLYTIAKRDVDKLKKKYTEIAE